MSIDTYHSLGSLLIGRRQDKLTASILHFFAYHYIFYVGGFSCRQVIGLGPSSLVLSPMYGFYLVSRV